MNLSKTLKCPKCSGKLVKRESDWAKFHIPEPSFCKRNLIFDCKGRCGEVWYENKNNGKVKVDV